MGGHDEAVLGRQGVEAALGHCTVEDGEEDVGVELVRDVVIVVGVTLYLHVEDSNVGRPGMLFDVLEFLLEVLVLLLEGGDLPLELAVLLLYLLEGGVDAVQLLVLAGGECVELVGERRDEFLQRSSFFLTKENQDCQMFTLKYRIVQRQLEGDFK